MARNLGIFFLVIILFGVLFMSVECCAQAVPPRVQTLQMIRPPAPPPEPPIQKEIRELKQEVRGTKQDLERLKTSGSLEELLVRREKELADYIMNPYAYDRDLMNYSEAARNNIIRGRIADMRDEIQTIRRMIARLKVRRQ